MMARGSSGRKPPGLTSGRNAARCLSRGCGAGSAGLAECRLQRRDAGLERLVFLTRQAGHVLDRLEILALDHVEIAQDALRLVAEQRLDLAPHALRGAGGVVHQPRDLVEEPVRGLDHGCLRTPLKESRLICPQTMAMVRRARKRCGAMSRASQPFMKAI